MYVLAACPRESRPNALDGAPAQAGTARYRRNGKLRVHPDTGKRFCAARQRGKLEAHTGDRRCLSSSAPPGSASTISLSSATPSTLAKASGRTATRFGSG
ncbi:hypothetical protein XAP412_860002 [Xanthomonas phaseoli pv. phaseoli]|uniref:Uncharacterized protein n=1 Tax=Xanthomonas campestris pv. phaseoli TaxID=317013 RepID=A0AB38E791_XANCH|nr:hypothetical protein XAP6984_890002 [Xanthomonas phaseoli pv. phaseoli]SON91114.1 hypothetical protein XAP412_860002 [Xanthomonas phaseoli pv. phaseoli]SON92790.1 hypothetical protein XAP7430_880002 [Xanthomonas phaseoli pv. phaseoli]